MYIDQYEDYTHSKFKLIKSGNYCLYIKITFGLANSIEPK